MYGYIYMTTNIINGKIYIGQHKATYFDANYYGSGKILKSAIKKYGINNFYVEVLITCNSKSELDKMEKRLIKQYNANNPNIGYNISYGGDGGDTFSGLSETDKEIRLNKLRKNSYFANLTEEQAIKLHSKGWITRRKNGKDKATPETKEKLRQSHLGKKPSKEQIDKIVTRRISNGYKHSEETKKKISESNKGKKHNFSKESKQKFCKFCSNRIGNLNPFFGKHHTEETKKLIGEKCGINTKGTKWMNNGKTSIRVSINDIEKYKNLGYILGRKRWKNV